MEDLQDAIQDAQYIGAMVDDKPKPTAKFDMPTDEECASFQQAREAKNKDAFSLVNVISTPLGFYLFKRHLKTVNDAARLFFVEETQVYKKRESAQGRGKQAQVLWDCYLKAGAAGPTTLPTEELGLMCREPTGKESEATSLLSSCSSNEGVLKISGETVDKIGELIKADNCGDSLPRTLFDTLEALVVESLNQAHYSDFVKGEFYKTYLHHMILIEKPFTDQHFPQFRILGRGGFGMVNGCKKNTTGKMYAMKMLNKKLVKTKKAADLCMNERNVLATMDSLFVVNLQYSYQTEEDLYLILDLMTGGDLSFHLSKDGRFDAPRAMFYAVQVALGLQHMHDKKIVYRDLKPENILLDDRGQTRISDLGLACKIHSNLKGRCGTRGYWAPEMLMKDEGGHRLVYNHCVDWWSFGCLVYELLHGKCPFRTEKAKAMAEDKQEAMDKATLEMEPDYSDACFNEHATDLISKLLVRDPKKRMGANGVADFLAHPWIELDLDDIRQGNMTAPFIPVANDINAGSQDDIGTFTPISKKVQLTEEDHAQYKGWEYINKLNYHKEIIWFLDIEEKQGPIQPVVAESCCIIL